ncbi:hypothetical protein D3C86_1062370 [compost metagenome]
MEQEHGDAAVAGPGQELPDRQHPQPHHLGHAHSHCEQGHAGDDAENDERGDADHPGDVGEQLGPAGQGGGDANQLIHQRGEHGDQRLAEGNAQRLDGSTELLPGVDHGLGHLLGVLQSTDFAQLVEAVFEPVGVFGQGIDHPCAFAAERLGQLGAGSGAGQVAKLALQLGQDVGHRHQLAVLFGKFHLELVRRRSDVLEKRLVQATGIAAFHGAAQRTDHRELLGDIDAGRGGELAHFLERILELRAVRAEELRGQCRLAAQFLNPLTFAHGVSRGFEQVVHGPDIGAHGLGVRLGSLGQQVAGVGEGGQLIAGQSLDRARDAVSRGHEVLGVLAVVHGELQRLLVQGIQCFFSHAQRANFAQGSVHLQGRGQ